MHLENHHNICTFASLFPSSKFDITDIHYSELFKVAIWWKTPLFSFMMLFTCQLQQEKWNLTTRIFFAWAGLERGFVSKQAIHNCWPFESHRGHFFPIRITGSHTVYVGTSKKGGQSGQGWGGWNRGLRDAVFERFIEFYWMINCAMLFQCCWKLISMGMSWWEMSCHPATNIE